VRILFVVNLRFPPLGKFAEGEVDPKVRPIGVTDGQTVYILSLLLGCSRRMHATNTGGSLVSPRSLQDYSIER